MARTLCAPPLCKVALQLPDVLGAPTGRLAMAVVVMPAARTLLAWDAEEASHAVSVFEVCAVANALVLGSEERAIYASSFTVYSL